MSARSAVWNSFSHCLPLIIKDLSWRVERGVQNFLGIYPICGLEGDFVLSRELNKELHLKKKLCFKTGTGGS